MATGFAANSTPTVELKPRSIAHTENLPGHHRESEFQIRSKRDLFAYLTNKRARRFTLECCRSSNGSDDPAVDPCARVQTSASRRPRPPASRRQLIFPEISDEGTHRNLSRHIGGETES